MEIILQLVCWLVQVAVVVLAYEHADKGRLMPRAAYLPRLAAVLAAVPAVIVLGVQTGPYGVIAALLLIGTVFTYIVTRWVTYRLRDCGWRESIALSLVLPLVNILVPLLLTIPKSWRPGDPLPRFTY